MKYLLFLLIPLILPAQIERWVYAYDGNLNQIDAAEALVCGLDGNIYAVGRTANYGTSSDFIVASLKDNGDTNWIFMYNPRNLEDIAFAVDYGLDHNIYAAGMSSAPASYADFTVMSMTTYGDTNWVYRHDGPSTNEDYDIAYAIVYGLDGNIYAGGTSKSNPGPGAGDCFVVSLSAAGDTNWTYRHEVTTPSGGIVRDIEYGADGNVYVAGHNWNPGCYYDMFAMSLSTDGDTNWTYGYGGALGDDAAYSVTYGLDGNVYVVGHSIGIDSSWYLTVISLTDDGDENWVFTYPSGFVDAHRPTIAITYGSDNNIYAAGKCRMPGQTDDFFVVSLNTAGDTNWTYQLDGSAHDDDRARVLVYGLDDNIYAAGRIVNTGTGEDLAIVSLDAEGNENWVYTYYAFPWYRWDEAYGIDCGWDGNVYAAGQGGADGGFWDYDFTVLSIDPTTGVEETTTDQLASTRLVAAPNPFSTWTEIRYSMPSEPRNNGYVPTISIYDASGTLVKSFDQESAVIWDGTGASGAQVPAGVYFATLEAENFTATEKLLLVR